MELSRDYMLTRDDFEPLNNGIIFRKNVSQFLNIRVDFIFKGKASIGLETVGSGFLDILPNNKLIDLLNLEKLWD